MTRSINLHHFAPRTVLALVSMLLAFSGPLHAREDVEITVLTQNQYFGTDQKPLFRTGGDPAALNAAIIEVLTGIGASNYPERVLRLAQTIKDSNADLVGLQEMYTLGCTPTSPTISDPCGLFGPAFNNHLQATLDALDGMGADYYLAAQVKNVAVESLGFPVPGLPVFLDADAFPDLFVTLVDKDVIIARESVPTSPVDYDCPKPSLDGCNFENVVTVNAAGIPVINERGFVAVDAVVRGDHYRFVNTHLEVRFPEETNPLSRFIQSAQATELIGLLATQPPPPDTTLLLVGDINSAPDDPYPSPTSGPFLTPYQQLSTGLSLQGAPISEPYNDVWTVKYGERPGATCCEDADLGNLVSDHDRRIDVVFSADLPDWIRVRELNTTPADKTDSGLWPSDHATVAAELIFND